MPAHKREWFPFVLPAAGYNSTDGLGVGVGGSVYSRPAEWDEGYRWQLTGGAWSTTGFRYQSHSLQLDWRGERDSYVGKIGYRRWSDMLYAGEGGADIIVDHGEAERQNFVVGPYGFLGVAHSVPGTPFAPYVQAYFRNSRSEPHPDGLLAERAPFGVAGGVYADVTVGVEIQKTDRWPVPLEGWRGEAGLAGGATFPSAVDGVARVAPVGNVHIELTRWQALAGERLVVGGRVVLDHSIGPRPFFEQEGMGGRWRDEIGSDQPFPGYGRSRTRGDGLAAVMTELRPLIVQTHHDFWDLGIYGSLFAEDGVLFDAWTPGPHLPSVGGGPLIVWQHALQFRPFVAWGWRSEAPGGPRRPSPQIGVSFQDPL